MNYFEKLTPNKKKFLESLGIYSDNDMPKSFFEPIKSCGDNMTASEYFYCGNPDVSGNYYLPFCIKDLIGTNHDAYVNKSWIEAFCKLDRGEENLEQYFKNPDYYDKGLKTSNQELNHTSNIGVINKDEKYYVYSNAGGGNNRMIIMKIKYLALAEGKSEEELIELNKQFTFYANTRILPNNIEIANIVEQILWYHYKEKYTIQNISDNPNVRVFNIMHGGYLDKKLVYGPLNEEEFINYSRNLIEGFDEEKRIGRGK